MLQGPIRLSVLAGAVSFGAIGAALMLAGAGVPFLAAAGLAAGACGLVQYAALRTVPAQEDPAVAAAHAQAHAQAEAQARAEARLDEYRSHTAALRHDLRGVLSPALMISDRLLRHDDAAVQRAGQTVVRTVERATALLSAHKDTLAAEQAEAVPRA